MSSALEFSTELESEKDAKGITGPPLILEMGKLRPERGRELPKAPQRIYSLSLDLLTPRRLRAVRRGWGPGTHGPESTWMEPTFSSRLSVRSGPPLLRACSSRPGSSPFCTQSPGRGSVLSITSGWGAQSQPLLYMVLRRATEGSIVISSNSSSSYQPGASTVADLHCPLVAKEGTASRNFS